jgi:zinc-ribbon domain
MFCPKCATQNVDGASFCRACGANISLVPQALTGQLPSAPESDDSDRDSRRKKRRGRPPSLDEGIRNLMMGIAFIVVSLLISRTVFGWTWWYWLLIPASAMIGKGVSELVRAKQARGELKSSQSVQPQLPTVNAMQNFPPRGTNELRPPVPSVTEGTTRHLGAEAPTRHFDSVTGEEKVR